jgi:serine/threonine protein phosphatase PrpC
MLNLLEIAYNSILIRGRNQPSVYSQAIQLTDNHIFLNTSIGLRRPYNEDRLLFARITNQAASGLNFAVAALSDGMGGMKDGGAAATISIAAFVAYIATGNIGSGYKDLCKKATLYANTKVKEALGSSSGATLSAILFGRNAIVGIWVGDSRIYHFAGNEIFEQLTTDDTIAAQIGNGKNIADEWANISEVDNRLAQHIGMGDFLEPHIIDLSNIIKKGNDPKKSGFLLTTDGAHYIGNKMIGAIISNCDSHREISNRLLSVAEWIGGHDNLSSIVIPDMNLSAHKEMESNETVIRVYLSGSESEIVLPIDRYKAENNKTILPAKQLTFDESMPRTSTAKGVFDKKELIRDQKPEQKTRKKRAKSAKKNKQAKTDNSRAADDKQNNSKGEDEAVVAKLDYISEDPVKICNGGK